MKPEDILKSYVGRIKRQRLGLEEVLIRPRFLILGSAANEGLYAEVKHEFTYDPNPKTTRFTPDDEVFGLKVCPLIDGCQPDLMRVI